MTSKAALVKALLDGRVLNIKNGFTLLSITNIPREIGRSIERSFNVKVSRTHREGKSRYGQPCVWIDYRLNRTEYNKEGIEKMKMYLSENMKEYRPEPKVKTIQQNIFSEL
jgi:hypothetical protein